MSTPQIIKVKDNSRGDYYKETDYVVTNLLLAKQLIYGTLPIVYRLYRGDDHLLVRSGETAPINNYIFKTSVNNLPSEKKTTYRYELDPVTGRYDFKNPVAYSTALPNAWDSSPMIANVGPETSVSPMCGEGPDSKNNWAKPVLRRRGRFFDDFGNQSSYFTISARGSTQFSLDKNSDPQTILSHWNAWLVAAGNTGINSAEADAKALYVWDSKGRRKITTLAQLAEVFPRYFQYEKQLEMDFMSSLGGNSTTNKYFVDGKWYEVANGYIGLWDQFAKTGLSTSATQNELIAMGYTQEQINAIRAVKGLTLYDLQKLPSGNGSSGSSGGGSGSSSGGSGGGRNSDGTKYTGPEGFRAGAVSHVTVNRSRNIFFGSDQFVDALSRDTSKQRFINHSVPIMYQVYMDGTTDIETGQAKINEHQFLLAPQDIQYSNFGNEWVSIERVGGFPFIDWKSFKLLQISFSFVVATKNGPVTGDGLDEPVTRQLEELQRMAQTPFPVMFFGFDSFMTNQFRYDDAGTPRGIQFVIQDLNIQAVRRNAKMEITRAQVNITLQEIPIEKTTLIGMPRLKHTPKIPGEEKTETDPEYGLYTPNLTQTPDKQLATTQNGTE